MKKSGKIFVGLALVAGLFLVAAPASAQVGFYFGTGVGYASPQWSGDLDNGDPQGGLGLEYIHLGYNFTDNWGVSLQWGAVAGALEGDVDTPLGTYDINDGSYGIGYLDLSGRYTFTGTSLPLTPYLELGLGQYVGVGSIETDLDDADLKIDPAVGYRLAVGGVFPLGRFYIAPELSYHMVEFDDITLETDHYGDFKDHNIGNGDFLLLLVKVGYSLQQQ